MSALVQYPVPKVQLKVSFEEAIIWLTQLLGEVTDPHSAIKVCWALGEANIDVRGYHHLLFQLDSTHMPHMHFGRQIFPEDDDDPIELGAEWRIACDSMSPGKGIVLYGALPGQRPKIDAALEWPEFKRRVSAVVVDLSQHSVVLRNMRVLST
jgi:hypothetical protein